jgi:chemotaxis protein methyltransferase CheR
MIAGIEHVAELIRRESGMALGPSRMPALAAAVERVAPGLDGSRVATAAVKDRGAAGILAQLIDEVAVNETFFFRHRRELDAIDWPDLARTAQAGARDHVRVWSAACASGEEAYTLGILAGEAFAGSTPPVLILASDISRRALDRARAGIYAERSVRQVPADLRAKYLLELGRGYGVDPKLRSLVRFQHHNLVSGSVPPAHESPFDLIVCRNVLIYFDPEVATRVVAALEGALAPGGTLLLGTADRLCGPASAFAASPVREPPRRTSRRPRAHVSRRPAKPEAVHSGPSLTAALKAADAGRLGDALEVIDAALAADPLHSDVHFVRGVLELTRGDAAAAVRALRRALYLDPQFYLAAFQLGRAHDFLSQKESARRAYAQALRILEQGHVERPDLIEGLDPADVEAACRARLHALSPDANAPVPERSA